MGSVAGKAFEAFLAGRVHAATVVLSVNVAQKASAVRWVTSATVAKMAIWEMKVK